MGTCVGVAPCVSLASTPRRARAAHTARPSPSRGSTSIPAHGPSRTYRDDPVPDQCVEPRRQRTAQVTRVGEHGRVAEQVDHRAADRAREGVAPERAAVLAGPQHAEHRLVATTAESGADPPAERLAQEVTLGVDARAPGRQQVPGAPEARLHLVGHHQRAGPVTDPPHVRQVAGRGDDDPSLALDRLQQHHHGVRRHHGRQRVGVPERHARRSRG